MTGLEKILYQIEEEAKSSAEKIIEEANKEAAAVLAKADATCQEMQAAAEAKAAASAEDILKKSRSAAAMQRKKDLLTAKQQVIGEVIDKAQQSLYAMDDAAYFALIEKMLEKFVLAESGEIRFNAKDQKRMPAGFDKKAAAIAQKKGGTLTVSSETCEIDGGFLLVYGGIEENCSFAAMFAAEKESLQDKVHTLLFT
ncbi:MAG: V-type ATP synthase subunit E [Lachnospiraceae bacterium]|nr:V-type ATP synthase subunit E [Lachnospiraceae bacterium]